VDLRGAFYPRRSLQDDAVPEQVDPARVSIRCSLFIAYQSNQSVSFGGRVPSDSPKFPIDPVLRAAGACRAA
jgi:hypothetical protein